MYYKSFDIIATIIIGYFSIFGMIKGFFGELFQILSIGLSILLSVVSIFKLKQSTSELSDVYYYSSIIGIPSLIFFMSGYIFLSITSKITNLVQKSKIRILDKILGIVFGLCKGALIIIILISIIDSIYPEFGQYVENSPIYKFIKSDHSVIVHIKNKISEFYQYINKNITVLLQKSS